MKLVRYGIKNKELPGIIDGEGKIRSLAGLVDEESEELCSSEDEELFFEDESDESYDEVVNKLYNTRSKNKNNENTIFTSMSE